MRIRNIFSVVVFATLVFGLSASEAKEKKEKREVTRKLASLAPVAPASQGQVMLDSLRSTKPSFLTDKSSRKSVYLSGVCRDTYGMTYYSQDKGYSACIDRSTRLMGASMDDYFGTAQRQAGAGLGIVLGK